MIIAHHALVTFLSPLSKLTQLVLTTTLAVIFLILHRKLGSEKLSNSPRSGVGQGSKPGYQTLKFTLLMAMSLMIIRQGHGFLA